MSSPPPTSNATPLIKISEAPITAPVPAAPVGAAAAPKPSPASFSVLEHTGIPKSVLSWKPRLPSRNWSIFIALVAGTGYAYYYDRQECARLKKEYKEMVEWRSKEKIGSLDLGRKVQVYAAKWPEDDDYDRGLLYFRRYVKPVLVAAAVDYELITSPQHGALSRHIHSELNTRRRQSLGLDPTPPPSPIPGHLNPEQKAIKESQDGVVIVGRHSLKEYLKGLERGWMGGVDKFDMERDVRLESEREDTLFKPVLEEGLVQDLAVTQGQEPLSQPTTIPPSTFPSPLSGNSSFFSRPPLPASPPNAQNPTPETEKPIPTHLHTPPFPLPPSPPMLLLPWTNHLGFKQIPYMFMGWFNERALVKQGGEAGLKLVQGNTREFVGRENERERLMDEPRIGEASSSISTSTSPASDLDFDLDSESFYKNNFDQLPKRIQEFKETYYTKLPSRITIANEIYASESNGFSTKNLRPKTAEEERVPPKTIEQLKDERVEKELRWKRDLEGWNVVKRGSPVTWRDEWNGWLRVYEDAVEQDKKV